ncbi:hypothetical protein [Salinibacter ruber]|uniref:hypothetical protein n=1 Tax=Salinibacter ruber TaxID=146919 RepID=UPI002168F863|nr:hypothetical protein [Salinibacter ruber]MCS3685812.1 hypothetical protein [Salinibacter ruber]
MAKDPNLPDADDKQVERTIGDLLPENANEDVPEDWSDVGANAQQIEEEERPRREQMNLDIADDVKRQFKEKMRDSSGQMRFVVEDLLRLYLDAAE